MADAHAALIDNLTRDLRPVTRLLLPWKRFALWLTAVIWIGLLLSPFTDFASLQRRLLAAPDMWISVSGAVATAALSSLATLQLSIPGNSGRWAFAPLPALVLWLGASAAGCLRLSQIAGVEVEPEGHSTLCFRFLLIVSLPLSALLGYLLVRACPLRPSLTAALGGLASAAAADALLCLIHPFDATYEDLGVHLIAVICVLAAAKLWGSRAFRHTPTFPARPTAG